MSTFEAGSQALRRIITKGRHFLRRQRHRYFPDAETRRYRAWISRQVQTRRKIYQRPVAPGLFSILTAVWDGSPVPYLQLLAESIASQHEESGCEWVLLDNGCSRREVLDCLSDLRRHPWTRIYRSEQNLGIVRGLRFCLEKASGRYVVPVDGDDRLYPDALKVVAAYTQDLGYPALLYTDEDKVTNFGVSQPYFKPDWDPVLLGNLAYIAHLGVIDRQEALRLGAYTDPATEGSPDWDLFLRFAAAGYSAAHIPEMVYSWRMHATSTAEDAHSKSYIMTSQQAVLANFVQAKALGERFGLENSPFFPGAPHWHFVRRKDDPIPMTCVRLRCEGGSARSSVVPSTYPLTSVIDIDLHSDPRSLSALAHEVAARKELLCFLHEDLAIERDDWGWEALGLTELFPDIVMIGARIRDARGNIEEAGLEFGFAGLCDSPDRGRDNADPGYFGQVWKQHSVSAVSLRFAVVRPEFLFETLAELPIGTSLSFLGVWMGANAFRKKKRVVYTPFLSGILASLGNEGVTKEEEKLFLSQYRDLLPDRRFYPKPLSLEKGYMLGKE